MPKEPPTRPVSTRILSRMNRRLAWRAMLILVGAAAGSAVWFTAIQKWSVGAFCPYCMTTHTIGVVLAVLVIWRAGKETEGSTAPVPAADEVSAHSSSRLPA